MCMWPFTNPGVTSRWRASITRSARAPASVAALPTRLTRPPSMRIEPSRMILRSRSTVRTYRALSILRLWVVMGWGLAPRSPPLELRATLLREGLHALLIVLAIEAVGDQLVQHRELALDLGTHELLDGCLGRAQGEWSVAGHCQRVVAGEIFKLRLRHDLVHEPHAEGVLGGEVGTGGEEDLLRVGRPDELHQLFHALVVITETQACRGDAEAGVVGGDAHIAADGDADTAADTETVDHRQEGLRQRAERVLAARRDAAVLLLIGHVAPSLLELRDVSAGHERLVARASQDHDPDGVVGGQVANVLGHTLPHLQAHGVALLRLVEDDPADRPVLLQQKLRRLAHGALLLRNYVKATCIASALVTQAPPCGGGQWGAAGGRRRFGAPPLSARPGGLDSHGRHRGLRAPPC